jgi:hypothetical protein
MSFVGTPVPGRVSRFLPELLQRFQPVFPWMSLYSLSDLSTKFLLRNHRGRFMEVAKMISRRELLKSSLSGCGAVGAAGALGSLFTRKVFAGGSSAGPVVRTTLGKLRGAFANGVYSFKGIHYGASTEGSMRFRPPSRPKPWTGVRDAFEVGPPAPQDRAWTDSAPDLAKIIPDMTGPGAVGEDCLVLNLWTPSLRGRGKRPVMVWLHGGVYTLGQWPQTDQKLAGLAAINARTLSGVTRRVNAEERAGRRAPGHFG